jgi:hypothetical protein
MPAPTSVLNPELLRALAELAAFVEAAVQAGNPCHEVERAIWRRILGIGRQAFAQFLARQGSGDLGETLTLPDGQTCRRLPTLHTRRYVSIFGVFQLPRTVYGARAGQAHEFVPLDNRLQLPASAFSYVLQDWDQALATEQAFGQVNQTIARILELQQSVDSLEQMNASLAAHVGAFRDNQTTPPPPEEGEVLVISADGKGIVLRRDPDAPAPPPHRTKGEKASLKRMATVGAVYSVDRYVRTPEDVVAALFRDPRDEPPPARPQPQHKHVWASLAQDTDSGLVPSVDLVYPWLLNEVVERNRHLVKEMVYLHDGQESLWDARRRHLPARNGTDILDLLHVTPRLWQAAHVLHGEGSDAAEQFVRARLLRVLRGEAAWVVRGLRQMGTKHGLSGAKQKTLATVCRYLAQNLERMRYGEYLAKGYPIASGVIEGACRHLVKDRMERAGMHWTAVGAQAMLDVRSVFVNGDWDKYQGYRIHRENQRLYPHRQLLQGLDYPLPV